eukprot:gene8655-6082_t
MAATHGMLIYNNDITADSLVDMKGDKKIVEQSISTMPNSSLFKLDKEDHTVANLLRMKLHEVPHPTQHRVELSLQTAADGTNAAVPTPKDALYEAIDRCLGDLQSFEQQLRAEATAKGLDFYVFHSFTSDVSAPPLLPDLLGILSSPPPPLVSISIMKKTVNRQPYGSEGRLVSVEKVARQRGTHLGAPVSFHQKEEAEGPAYAVQSVDALTQSPHTIALLLLLILTSLLLIVLDVVADVFQLEPKFPSVPVMATSNGLTVFSLAVTVALGTHILPQFHMFDPLEGGESFFAMQMGGYGLSLSSMILKVLLLMETNAHHVPRYGGLSILGIAAVVGHSLLVSSFLYFVMPRKSHMDDSGERFFHFMSPASESRPYRDIVVVTVLFCGLLLSTSVSAAWSTSALAAVLHDIALLLFALFSMTVIQLRGERAVGSGDDAKMKVLYSSFRPYTGSIAGLIWQVWAHLLLFGALFAVLRMHTVGTVGEAVIVWRIAATAAILAAVMIHTVLLYASSTRADVPAAQAGAEPEQSQASPPRHPRKSRTPLFITIVAICVYATIHGITLFDYAQNELGFKMFFSPLSLQAYRESGVLQFQGMFGLLLCMMPPLTHFQGRLLFGRTFEIWNPFGGNGEFLLLQIASWTIYGAAGLTFILHLTHPRRLHILFITTLLLLAQIGMQLSLQHFDPSKTSFTRWTSSFRGERALASMTNVQRTSIVIRTVFNGELLLAVVFAGLSIIIRALCDVEEYIQSDKGSTNLSLNQKGRPSAFVAQHTLLHIANLFTFMCVPVAQMSMRHHIRLFVDVDQRSTGYVLLITIGWTMYLGGTLAGVLQLLLYGAADASPSLSHHGFALYYSFEGFFFAAPLLCLVSGFIFEMNQVLRSTMRSAKFLEMTDKIRSWVANHPTSAPEQELAEFETTLRELEKQVCYIYQTVAHRNVDERDAEAVKDAAVYITVLTSVVSTFIFVVAALLVDTGRSIPISFGVTGLLVVTLSCCNLQHSYGHRLHDAEAQDGNLRYTFFMPFRGGKTYILLQAVGWSAFTLCWFLMIATSIEGQPSAGNLLVLAATSSLAQICVLASVGYFDGSKAEADNFIAHHAEGLLAAATIVGTFFCSRLYEAASLQRYSTEMVPLGGSSPVPVVMCALSFVVAVPMGLVSMQRQAQESVIPIPPSSPCLDGSSLNDMLEEDEEDSVSASLEGKPMQNAIWQAFSPPGFRRDPVASDRVSPFRRSTSKSRRKQRQQYLATSLTRILALLVVYLIPFIIFFLLYTYHLQLEAMFRVGVVALKSVGVALSVLLTLPIAIPVLVGVKQMPETCRQMYYYACAWWMWSVPTMTVVGGLSPPLFANTSGAWLWFGNMTVMCCLSTIPHLPLIGFLVNTAVLGLFTHRYLYVSWYLGQSELDRWTCAGDLFAALFWTWYDTRYFGRPHITGRLFNRRVRYFFKHYVFYGAARYFNARVIRVKPYSIPEEVSHMGDQAPEPPVDRRDPKRQYLFSFHPHGVFPGSSLYLPCTSVWEDLIGVNEENRITTHGADVIFMCPIMRELPLCVGALSVARRGIENSISKGNSPLIITGGQSEMLLTKWSQTEMHLVCHHLGFIKLAMRHHIPLVPVLSFSECNIMENVHWLKVQRWFVKRIGFPALVLPHGWCYLPLPTHLPVTLVVGQPLRPYPNRDNVDDPACVEEMRARYFNHLQTIFYQYRAEAGYPDMVLYLHNGIYDPGLRIPPPDEAGKKSSLYFYLLIAFFLWKIAVVGQHLHIYIYIYTSFTVPTSGRVMRVVSPLSSSYASKNYKFAPILNKTPLVGTVTTSSGSEHLFVCDAVNTCTKPSASCLTLLLRCHWCYLPSLNSAAASLVWCGTLLLPPLLLLVGNQLQADLSHSGDFLVSPRISARLPVCGGLIPLSSPSLFCWCKMDFKPDAAVSVGGLTISTITLAGLWFLNLSGALFCYVLAEVYQGLFPEFPLVFVVALGTQLQGLCPVMSYFMGRQLFGSVYKVYQPFQGGVKFIILQFLGIFNVSASIMASLVYIFNFDVRHHYPGVFAALELAAFVGNAMILLSLRFYQPLGDAVTSEAAEERLGFGLLQRAPNSQSAVVVALMVGQCVVASLPRHFSRLRFHCAVIGAVIHAVNGVILHFIIGCRHTPGYSPAMFYLPRTGDTFFFWLKWSCYWIAMMIFCFATVTTRDLSSNALIDGATMLSVLTTTMVLLFVRTTRFTPRRGPSRVSFLVNLSSFSVIFITTVMGAFTSYTAFYLEGTNRSVQVNQSLKVGSDDYIFQRNMLILLFVCHTFSLFAAPLAFFIGRMVYGDDFNCFTQGRCSFVFMHVSAGGLYTAAVFSCLLFVVTRQVHFSLVAATGSVLAPLCLVNSFRVVEPVKRSQPPSAAHSPLKRSMSSSGSAFTQAMEPAPGFSHLLNGYLAVGYICWLCSFIIRLVVNVCDMGMWGEADIVLPISQLLIVANICFVLAVPLVHISAGEHGIRIFHPFSGSGAFVALQVIGWMIYACLIIFSGLSFFLVFTHHSRSLDPQAWSQQSTADVWMSNWKSTLVGFLEFIPMCLITLSISIESQVTLSVAVQREIAKRALVQLAAMTNAAMEGKSEEQIRETQLLLETLLQPALEYFQIQDAAEDFSQTDKMESPSSSESPHFLQSPVLHHTSSVRQRHQGAYVMVVLLALASITFFVLASFFTNSPTFSAAMEVLGFLVCTVSCAGIHAGYGMLLHGHTGEFSVFIPFKGGKEFVYWQVGGWLCYSCVFLISLLGAVDPSYITPTVMSVTSVLSVASQAQILRSIPLFVPQRDGDLSFLEENGEGMVAFLAFAGAYGFQCLYDSLHMFFSGTSDGSTTRGNIGFVMMVVSMSIALPCIFIAIGRTTSTWSKLAHHKTGEDGESVVVANAVVRGLQFAVVPMGSLVPLSVAYVVYSLSQSYTPGISWLMESSMYVAFGTVTVVVALSLVQFLLNVGMPSVVVHLQVSFITWCTYGLPMLVAIAMLLLVLTCPRYTSYLLVFFLLFMTVCASYKWAITVMKMVFYGSLAHTVLKFANESRVLYQSTTPEQFPWLCLKLLVPCLLFDLGIVGCCIRYMARFNGMPSITGSLRSEKFILFMRRHIFSCCAKYFRLEVHVDDESVNLRDPNNQYLFSYHPHGVFPGTALYAPLTQEWVDKMGTNDAHHISTHVASVVLSVPVVRDFNLSLGSLSVSRRGIDASLKRGNSIIIVTGGQAEMLHTQISDKVLNLVTHHKGFFRVAISHKVPLVPLLCFGEHNLMGLIQFPTIHRITLPLFGFPFPMVPYGRFGLPIPRPAKLVLVVGRKIDIPEGADPNDEELIEKLRVKYFDALKALFYRHREAAGYPELELNLINKTHKKQEGKGKTKGDKSKKD